MSQARIRCADQWSLCHAPWARLFVGSIPGFRVPLTVLAGIFELPYRIFAISVAVSSAIWAGVFLALGAVFGSGIERSIRSNLLLFGAVVVIVVVVVAAVAFIRSRRHARQA